MSETYDLVVVAKPSLALNCPIYLYESKSVERKKEPEEVGEPPMATQCIHVFDEIVLFK